MVDGRRTAVSQGSGGRRGEEGNHGVGRGARKTECGQVGMAVANGGQAAD